MDCNRSHELMSLALDDQLSKEQQIELKTHLESCDDCKETYEHYQSIKTDLSLIGSEEPLPDGFHSTLMERIETDANTGAPQKTGQENKVQPLWRRLNRRTMNVAAMLTLVVVFALVGIRSLNQIGVSDEAAIMNDMGQESEALKVAMDEESMANGLTPELADSEMLDATMSAQPSSFMDEGTSSDTIESDDGKASEAGVDLTETTEVATMRVLEVLTGEGEDESSDEEGQLAMAPAIEDEPPHLARTEEAEVTSYKAKDREGIRSNDRKSYTEQGNIEGHRYLVWLIFGGFVLVTGLGSFLIVRRMK